MGIENIQELRWLELTIFLSFTPTIIGTVIVLCKFSVESLLYNLLLPTVFYLIRQSTIFVLHFGVKRRKKYCVVCWNIYYVLEMAAVLTVAIILVHQLLILLMHNTFHKFELHEKMEYIVMLLVTVMIFVDVCVHVLCYSFIVNFTTTLNNAPRNEERRLEQDPISIEQGVDFQRMEIGSNGK